MHIFTWVYVWVKRGASVYRRWLDFHKAMKYNSFQMGIQVIISKNILAEKCTKTIDSFPSFNHKPRINPPHFQYALWRGGLWSPFGLKRKLTCVQGKFCIRWASAAKKSQSTMIIQHQDSNKVLGIRLF
jgi:hypothetical protein